MEAENWQDLWLLGFHPKKCKAMTVSNAGSEREDAKYTLQGLHLDTVSSEEDLGVISDSRLSFSEHIQTTVNKAHRVMGAIRRTYRHLNGENFALLYKALVRPHLEYAHAVWKPYLKKHINLLEGVQRRATKQLPTYRNLS